MAEVPPASPPRRRWFRKAAAPAATTSVCPACQTRGPKRLVPGEVCAQCQSQAAWSQYGHEKLVIDRAAITAAEAKRQGELAGEPLWRRGLRWAPGVVSLALAIAALLAVRDLLAPRDIGPLAALLDGLSRSIHVALGLGLLGLVGGVVGLVRLRRQHHYRRWPLIVAHGLAIAAGTTAFVIGAFLWWGTRGGYGGAYRSMPPRADLAVTASEQRILDATVVVLAPDGDGDARFGGQGTGAVVATDAHRAWIVTCSHVAMPYAAVGAIRDPRAAHPVWIQLADGREGRATVRWVAPPPLDVAVVEMKVDDPPLPITISPDASGLEPGAAVTFVPMPYRNGWMVVRGQLLKRESHKTPAGTYDLLFTDLPVIPGDSGSGLYDASGRLVGLNTWTRRGSSGAAEGISLPSETMRALVLAIERGDLDGLDRVTATAERGE